MSYFFLIYSNGLPASAICAFEKSEIDRVLNGPFKTQDSDMSFWTEAKASTVPSPRPGQVKKMTYNCDNFRIQNYFL